MNKQTLARLQDAIERAIQALEQLEQAIDAGDYRKIGARLYELRSLLENLLKNTQR